MTLLLQTLTAESVAETMHAPLYTMSAGDLGVEMSNQCNAIPPETSSSRAGPGTQQILLRLLEYYEGILFLTTDLDISHPYLHAVQSALDATCG